MTTLQEFLRILLIHHVPLWLAFLAVVRFVLKRRNMGFVIPQFNLTCNVLHDPKIPGDAPSYQVECQISVGEAHAIAHVTDDALASYVHAMWLRLPFNTDIRSKNYGTREDYVEVPAWSGRWYRVASVDDFGAGFANEHRFAIVIQDLWRGGPWPNARGPYFPPPPPPPPANVLGNYSTANFPANNLPTPFTVSTAAVVMAHVCWEGTAGIPTSGAPGFGPVLGTYQTQMVGGVPFSSALFTAGPQAAGVYPCVWTFPALAIGQMQIIIWEMPAGVGVTNGNNSGFSGPLLVSGNTLLTTSAPANVYCGILSIGVTGLLNWFPPVTTFASGPAETVGGVLVLGSVGIQPGLANGIFGFAESGTSPMNASWWASMLK